MAIAPNAIYQADCLTLLERIESDKVMLVYIDPPWNTKPGLLVTGENQEMGEYRLFMFRVLEQIHRVLCEAGSLFVHLEPRIDSVTRRILDQTFGIDSFRTEIVWPRHQLLGRSGPKGSHETIVVYSKSDSFVYNPQFRPLSKEEVRLKYNYVDERGAFRVIDLTSPISRLSQRFEWKGTTPPESRSWRYSKERLDELDEEGRIYHRRKDSGLPGLRAYLDESPGLEVGSVWDDIPPVSRRGRRKGRFWTYKPVELLERIVRMGSNPGDLVLDPMCRDGQTLVAAQAHGRKWLGCEGTSEGYSLFVEQMREKFGLEPGVDFTSGDQAALQMLPVVCTASTSTALLLTEGKTDWKHLKAALTKLQDLGRFSNLSVEFHEYEDDDMGDSKLLEECSRLSETDQAQPVICIFDRDNPKIVRKVSGRRRPYKSWGNRVFSFALPVPQHRQNVPDVCIELYYEDCEIKRTDQNGRRLFLSNEFDIRSGRHSKDPNLNCTILSKVRKPNRVFLIDDSVFDERNENVALPKNDFAKYVLTGTDNFNDFDVSAFKEVFDIVSAIVIEAICP